MRNIDKQGFSYISSFFQAAKETEALQDAKTKLENQVEELTSNLELEKQMRVNVISSI